MENTYNRYTAVPSDLKEIADLIPAAQIIPFLYKRKTAENQMVGVFNKAGFGTEFQLDDDSESDSSLEFEEIRGLMLLRCRDVLEEADADPQLKLILQSGWPQLAELEQMLAS